ncbi:MAG: MFS transporter [Bacteroidota bacterium]
MLRTAAILFPLWLMVFTAASQTIIITPILPILGEALDAEVAQLGWLVSAYSYALAFAALVMGPISDRIGRRRVLLIGSGAIAVVLGLHGLATSFASFASVRVLAGMCGGMLSGAAVAYCGDYFPYEKRGWATGLVMSGVPFGLVIGIPIGRVLAASLGYRIPFMAFAVIMAVAFLMILLLVPQPDVQRDTDAITLKSGLQRYGRLLGDSDVRVASLTYFLMYMSLSLLVVLLPQWLTDNFALGVSLFGRPLQFGDVQIDFIATLFLVGGTVSVLIGPTAGTLSDRIGRKPLILASCLGLAAVSMLLTELVVVRWVAYPVYIAIMGLFSMRMAPLQALLTALVPAQQRGSFMSLTIAIGQIGTGFGATFAGWLYARYGYVSDTLASGVVILLMAWLVWKALPEPTEDAQAPVG